MIKTITTIGLFLFNLSSMSLAVSPDLENREASYPWVYSFTNHEGKKFNLADYKGKIILYSFFFTECSSICPTQTYQLANIQKRLPVDLKGKVQFISISIDPNNDLPEKVKAYAERYGISFDNWQFGIINEPFLNKLLTNMGMASTKDGENEELNHSATIVLVDQKGRIIQRYLSTNLDSNRIISEIKTVDRLFK